MIVLLCTGATSPFSPMCNAARAAKLTPRPCAPRNVWSALDTHSADIIVYDATPPMQLMDELFRKVNAQTAPLVHLIGTFPREHEARLPLRISAHDMILLPAPEAELRTRLLTASNALLERRAAYEAKHQAETLELKYQQVASTDPLTGIGNRAKLAQDLTALAARSQRYGTPHAILFFDVDRFKSFNDAHGHIAGDRALVAVSQCLEQVLRSSDCLYRFGGEEFVAILYGEGYNGAGMTAKRCCDAVRALGARHRASPHGRLTISAGVAVHVPGESIADTVQRADEQMYRAKRCGGSRAYVSDLDAKDLRPDLR